MDSSTLRAPIKSLNPAQPICVSPETPVEKVIEIMRDNRIGCVCVVKGHELVGIFTERDVLKRVFSQSKDLTTKVSEVMTGDPEYLYHDDEIAFALNRMHVGGFRHVPLLGGDGQPVGVISIKDIVGHMMKDLKDLRASKA